MGQASLPHRRGGAGKLRNGSHRIQEIAQQLVQTSDVASAEKLFGVIVAKGDLEQFGYVSDVVKMPKFDFDATTKAAAPKRIIDPKFTTGQNTFSYVRSYQPNGKIDNPIFKMLNSIAESDNVYAEICEAMEEKLAEKPEETLPRALLATVHAGKKKWEELETTITPWEAQLAKAKNDDELPSAIWSVASQIPDDQIGKMANLLVETVSPGMSAELLTRRPTSPVAFRSNDDSYWSTIGIVKTT